jgi:hypothetical protein
MQRAGGSFRLSAPNACGSMFWCRFAVRWLLFRVETQRSVRKPLGCLTNRAQLTRVASNIGTVNAKYRKPPIIERALAIHVDMAEEKFRLKAETWPQIVQQDFPRAETMTEWTLAVTEKDGMPVLDPSRQTMTLRQTFWHVAGKKKQEGIQLWLDKISFNLLGEPGNPRDYAELDQVCERWLMRWATHFEISECSGVTLEYVNLLSAATLPSFVSGKTIRIGEVVNMFKAIPGTLHALHPPFDFQFNVDGETDPSSRFRAHCATINVPASENTAAPQMQLRFTATTNLSKDRRVPLAKVRDEARVMHDLILGQFDAYFTPEAKKSFEPICP